jgi:hypothetical protein
MGTIPDVQAAFFRNAESLGINPSDVLFAAPFWGLGKYKDYSQNIHKAFFTGEERFAGLFRGQYVQVAGGSSKNIYFNKSIIPANTTKFSIRFKVEFSSSIPGSSVFRLGQYNETTSAYDFGLYRTNTNLILFFIKNSSDVVKNVSFGTLSTGVAYNLAVTYDGQNIRAYNNGVLVDTTALTGDIKNSDDFCIGKTWFNKNVTCGEYF